jgi:hypothetical protein
MMTSAELLEMALETARRYGYHIRHEWLGGVGSAACEFSGKKWIFIDLSLGTEEQLEQVESALIDDPGIGEQRLIADVALQLQAKQATAA